MAKSAKASGAKKRKKADTSTFKTYIARVLRQVHPKVRISQKSMSILNSLVQDTFDKVASEGGLRGAGGLARGARGRLGARCHGASRAAWGTVAHPLCAGAPPPSRQTRQWANGARTPVARPPV